MGVTVPDKLQPSVSQSPFPFSDSTEPEQRNWIATQATQPSQVSEQQKSQSEQTQLGGAGLNDLSKPSQQSSSLSIASKASKSGEGLNVISLLVDAESAKALSTETPSQDGLVSRSHKNSKRRGSCSSTNTLSDIIQDIKISPREAMVAAGGMSTEGKCKGQVINPLLSPLTPPPPILLRGRKLMSSPFPNYSSLILQGRINPGEINFGLS